MKTIIQQTLDKMFDHAMGECDSPEEILTLIGVAAFVDYSEIEKIRTLLYDTFPSVYRAHYGKWKGDVLTDPSEDYRAGIAAGATLDPNIPPLRPLLDDEQPEPEETLEEMHEENRRLIQSLSDEKDGLLKVLDELKDAEVSAMVPASPQAKPLRYPASTAIAEKVEEEKKKLNDMKELDEYHQWNRKRLGRKTA